MEQCIDCYGPLVWSIILRRVGDRSAAEDLAQEIFTEIWRKADRHNPALSSEAGYIAMIARRRTIDWLRRKQRMPDLVAALPEIREMASEAMNPDPAVDPEDLWQALRHLPEETRQLFSLHFQQGMSQTEIAEKTGLPLGTVKTRLRRGLIEARALLKKAGSLMNPTGGALP